MNNENAISVASDFHETKSNPLEDILSLAERMDFLDVQLLRKFYMTTRDFPNDTQPYCFPVLFMEMKVSHKVQIGLEAMRKRLDNLVKLGFLEKVAHSNPANYSPIRGQEQFVRALITKFFVLNGLSKFI